MADHNIEINVNLNGSERTKQELQNLKSTIDNLNNSTVTPKLATAQINQQIQAVKREIQSLTGQKTDILSSLGVKNKDVDKRIDEVRGKISDLNKEYDDAFKSNKNSSLSKMAAAQKQIRQYEDELNKLNQAKGLQTQIDAAKELQNEMRNTKIEIQNDASIQKATEDMERLNQEKEKLDTPATLNINADSVDEARSKVEKLASVLDTASSVLGGAAGVSSALGDFGGMFASAFEGMSNIFKFDAVGTASRYLTAMATRAVTGQISGILERYDIMNTFVPYMDLAGIDASTAQASLNRVDQSIRGIPIGLDEAAFRLRKYQMYMNDIDRATNFTIGIQKAITAGGASEQMKTTAYTQIDRLLATGKLGQSRQWLSLFNGLGVSLRFLREELALDPAADLKQIAGDLANGTIATDDFLRAIERLADNEGLDRALEIYKSTIEAWRSNISNAIKRGGQGILESVNETMEGVYGEGITGAMKFVRDQIDVVSKDAAEYIRDNPENTKTLGDAVTGLYERFMSLDGGRFADNIVTNLGGLADTIGRIFDSIPPGFIEDFSSFAMTWAGPMATVMKAAQSGLPMVLGIFDAMKDWDMGALMEKISTEMGNMAGFISTIMNTLPEGFMGDLMAFGLVWGKPLGAALGAVSGALKDISGVMAAGGSFSAANGIFGQLTSLAMMHPVLTGVATAIGAIAIGIKRVYDAEAERQQTGRDMFGLDEIDSTVSQYRALGDTIESEQALHEANLEVIKQENEEMLNGIDTVFSTYERYQATQRATRGRAGSGAYEDLKEAIEELALLNDGLDLSPLLTGGLTDEQVANMRTLAETYAEMTTAEANVAELEVAQQSAREMKATAQIQKGALESTRTRLQQELSQAERTYEQFRQIARERGTPYVNDWGEEDVRLNREDDQRLRDLDAGMSNLRDEITSLDTEIAYQEALFNQASWALDGYNDSLLIARRTLKQYADMDFSAMYGQTEILDESLQSLVDNYNELKVSAAEALDKTFSGFDKIDPVKPAAITEMTSGLTSQNDALLKYGEALETIRSSLSGLSDEELAELAPAIGKALDGGFENAEYAIGLANALTGSEEDLKAYVEAANALIDNKDAIASAIADIQLALNGGSEAEEATREHPELFPGLQEALDGFQGLEEVDLSDFISNIQSMSSDAGEAFGDVEQAASNASSQIDAVKTSVEQAASTASGQAGTMGSFAGSLDSVAGSAANAFSNVSALAGAISRLQNKTVTIRVNVLGSLGRASHGGMAGYFASGGNVLEGFPGMASGSDTIPAWLTPGEYVIRRSAVGMFGSRLMDRINKMDIGGAFDALMSRISNPMNLHGNTYNRDNHATVNNYFYGDNGQNYSQRKAYRYAGSL